MVSAKKIIVSSLVVSIFAVVAVLGLGSSKAIAQGTENQPEQQEQNQESSNQTYDYVAQPGDSYSLIARKAVQTYGIVNNVNLSQAQIIFVETNLTQKAGSPELNEGQKVQVSVKDVEEWVNKAKDLTQAQQAAWSVYAANANFNTNSVGQSS